MRPLSALLLLSLTHLLDPSPKFALHIEAAHDGVIIARPYTAPAFAFVVTKGVVTNGDILYCQQETKMNGNIAVVTIHCDDGSILELKGIYLDR